MSRKQIRDRIIYSKEQGKKNSTTFFWHARIVKILNKAVKPQHVLLQCKAQIIEEDHKALIINLKEQVKIGDVVTMVDNEREEWLVKGTLPDRSTDIMKLKSEQTGSKLQYYYYKR